MGDYDRGLGVLRQLGGVDRPAVLELFRRVNAEDFGAEAVAFVYGGVYQRPGLSLPQRQLITVSALTALGFAAAQLRFHLTAARNVGCSVRQLRDTLHLVAATLGSPTVTSVAEAAAAELDGDGPALDGTDRHLVLLSAHTALGGVAPQVREHAWALRAAGEGRAAVEAILHLAIYAGFPAALNALTLVASDGE
ncbi:carboxymuconolactone decarboxylase family protein [Allokutzneria oryzae]|uniref:Carboxymuconolactone decarboxylase family protein n=1 Tax=Allokutzneria oryzae TaxID=1378989 RepID=A0ABV6A234_9PSEU